ncbi:MAG: shikimate dehydrogenase [Verrucomicrobiales bacterium]
MSAKDQYSIDDLENWTAAAGDLDPPAILGVFGDPVAHSLSPHLHNPALQACGIAGQYVRLHIGADDFARALRLLPDLGFVGANVTIPHKFAALAAVDEVDPLARKLGAVNTVVFEDGRALGFNSDGPGFLRAIREEFGIDAKDLRIAVLGAGGGAGRAVAVQLALEGCERLVLMNRTREKAEALRAEIEPYFAESERLLGPGDRLAVADWTPKALEHELAQTDLIVNATSLGMKRADPELVPEHLIGPHHLVYDMVYKPPRTKLLAAAKAMGARGANGLSMLLWQGAISFEHWFEREAPAEAMRQGLMDAAAAVR